MKQKIIRQNLSKGNEETKLRDEPLENLWGGGWSTKKILAQEEINWKKIHAHQLTLKNIHATALKKFIQGIC